MNNHSQTIEILLKCSALKSHIARLTLFSKKQRLQKFKKSKKLFKIIHAKKKLNSRKKIKNLT